MKRKRKEKKSTCILIDKHPSLTLSRRASDLHLSKLSLSLLPALSTTSLLKGATLAHNQDKRIVSVS